MGLDEWPLGATSVRRDSLCYDSKKVHKEWRMDQLLALFPLHTVLFPGTALPLHIFEDRYKRMIGRCMALNEPFGVVLIREGHEVGGEAEPFEVGTTAAIVNALPASDGRLYLIAEGRARFRIQRTIQSKPYLVASVELLDEPVSVEQRVQAQRLCALYEQYRAAVARATGVAPSLPDLPDDAAGISYQLSAQLQVPYQSKQELLEADLDTRLESLIAALDEELRYLPPATGAPLVPDNRWTLN